MKSNKDKTKKEEAEKDLGLHTGIPCAVLGRGKGNLEVRRKAVPRR